MLRRAGFSLVIAFAAAGCGGHKAAAPDGGQGGTTGTGAGGTSPTSDAGVRDSILREIPLRADAISVRDATTGTAGTSGGGAGIGGTTGLDGGSGAGGATGAAGMAGGAGGATPTDGGSPPDGQVLGGVNLMVFTGTASVLDQGPSCTSEAGATGDRWCAFIATSNGSTLDLYVVNVSRAIAGVSITCGLPDPNCLHLTAGFDEPDNLHGALFQGDTLVYFDSSGTPYAWRPGMTTARRLIIVSATTGDVLLCLPASQGTGVMCLRDLPTQTNPNLIQSDLLAGRVDGTADPPLTRVDGVISGNAADTDYSRFTYGFPRPGYISWSSRATASGPEILKVQQIDNAATRATVASDVHGGQASPDGAHWYWLAQFDGTTNAGTLQSATFPSGAGPATVLANTVQFAFPTPTSTSLVTLDSGLALSAIADPIGAPTTRTAIDTGVLGFLGISTQGHIGYIKTYDGTSLTDLFVKKWDGTGTACTLTSTVNAFYASFGFAPGAGAAVWARSPSANVFDGVLTRLSDCANMTVATNIGALGVVGDRAAFYLDQFDTTTSTGSLNYFGLTGGSTLAGATPTLVAGQVGSFDVGLPAPGTLIYTVNGGTNADGVYLRYFGP
jgi:hypothetical protein